MMSNLQALFEAHPPPWVVDDNRPSYEGEVTVWDVNGEWVACTGDMEGCTAADIEKARLFAAAPALWRAAGFDLNAFARIAALVEEIRAGSTNLEGALDIIYGLASTPAARAALALVEGRE